MSQGKMKPHEKVRNIKRFLTLERIGLAVKEEMEK
jgi:hypothetical protein